MRYLALTDIHSNLEALDAVLRASAAQRYDAVLVLGDLVGYGADPNAVVDCVRKLGTRAIVRGNHDKVASGLDNAEDFNPMAKAAARWTRESLTPQNLDYLRDLPAGPVVVDVAIEICHGSPLDEDLYVVADIDAARSIAVEPPDQRELPRPRLGFFGVLDERLDLPLLRGIAEARPAWQLVMIGPVVKIDPADLPRLPNIHYLGAKRYEELPAYLAGWDLALLLFARNDATRFISPTKTPEYLAAGKPVVSTSIRDVVTPYGDRDLVRIADTVDDFVNACANALREVPEPRRIRADVFLRGTSWDRTWAKTAALVDAVTDQPALPAAVSDGASLRLGA